MQYYMALRLRTGGFFFYHFSDPCISSAPKEAYLCLHAGCGASFPPFEDLDLHIGTHVEVPYVSNNDRFDCHHHPDIVTPGLGYNYQASVPPAVAIFARPTTDPIPSIVSANGPGHSQVDAVSRPLPVYAAYSHDLGRVPDLECHAKKHQPGAKIY